LYRNELPLLEMRSVNPQQLRNLYVVDTQQGDRLT
jgi:tRNA nucleotidyltransferase (CCA-adding enzyme)